MKIKQLLYVINFLFITFGISAQNATLFLKDKTSLEVKLRIEQNTFSQTQVKIFYKENESNFKNLELESISKIVIKEHEYFIKNIDFHGANVPKLLQKVKSGELNLWQMGTYYFLENKEYGLKLVSKLGDLNKSTKYFEKGILILYVNKCQETYDRVFNLLSVNYNDLTAAVTNFNNCELNTTDSNNIPTSAIQESIKKDDASIMVGIGLSMMSTDFSSHNNLKDYDLNKNQSLAYNLSISSHLAPNAVKNIGFYSFGVKYIYQPMHRKTYNLENSIIIDEQVNQVNLNLGLGIYLLKNNTTQIYAGMDGVGVFNFSKVTVQDSGPNHNLFSKKFFSNLTYSAFIGSNLEIFNHEININIEYCPGYKYDIKPTNIDISSSDSDQYKIKTSFVALEMAYKFF